MAKKAINCRIKCSLHTHANKIILSRNFPGFVPCTPLRSALHIDFDVSGPPRVVQCISRTIKYGRLVKNIPKSSKTDWHVGVLYLSFQELDKSLYYRLVALEVSAGADNWRKAGPAEHSGLIGSGPLLHRSPCTAEKGKEEGVRNNRDGVLSDVSDIK